MRPLLLLALLVLPAACAVPNDGEDGEQTAAGTSRWVGTVAVVGSAPMNVAVVLRDDDPRAFNPYLTGPLVSELRRLSGLTVAVEGEEPERPGWIEVERYQVLSLDGDPVVAGVVERGEEGELVLRTSDGTRYPLSGAEGRVEPGWKIWVKGDPGLALSVYGVIRD
ncbi:MAG: hypothetical protein ACREKN_04655 [Longimicrobiaceae bacterium]